MFVVATAGWAIPRDLAARFAPGESALERYASVFDGVEINSSFWRRHRETTWARWAATVPAHFRFAVKVPRTATHVQKLAHARPVLDELFQDVKPLGDKLGPLLVQLPPSLAFDARAAGTFFRLLRARHDGDIACEPRHPSWMEPRADALLESLRVARVAADPPAAGAALPGGDRSLAYFRMHGSPRKYYSAYGEERLGPLAAQLAAFPRAWCVFDNTASGAGAGDALCLRGLYSS